MSEDVVGAGPHELVEARRPRLSLDMDEKLAASLSEVRPGMPVKMLIHGVVESISFNDSESGVNGYLCIEVGKARMTRDYQNAVADMFYEDEGPENG